MMLELDEKKIRKGKPIGLPYKGSKKGISKKIVEIIKQNFGTEKPVYDIFGGGGAITAECLLNGLEVHYNDLDRTIADMFQRVLATDREFLKTLIVSRDEFFRIRDKEDKTVDDELKLLVNSFGNDRKTYLYSRKFSDLKYNLAIKIIKNHDTFDGYKKTDTYKNAYRPFDIGKVDRSQVLQQLQRLHQLQRLQQLECVEATNMDYTEFSDIENAILYLDPPYENTLLKGYSVNEFNSQSFYDWAFKMANKNIVLISSYEISDSRFKCVYEFKNARSTLSGGNRGKRTEKLFMVKKGEE